MQPVDYARLAQRAYSDTPTVGLPDSASRMHVYTLDTGPDAPTVHVFRGTDDLASFVADADSLTVYVEGLGHVHAGFYKALAAILPACLALPRPVAVAGHSLGAAMAILYAGVLALLGAPAAVYAFEPPGIYDRRDDEQHTHALRRLLTAAGKPWFACRNGKDIITQIPPGLTLPGPLTAVGHAVLPFDNLEDHAIARVIAALA